MPKPTYTVEAVNSRLKLTGTKVKVQVIGSALYLRGTFPPKPGSGRHLPYQQRLTLGYSANDLGLKRAEALARKIYDEITLNTFDWANYLETTNTRNPLMVSELVKRFEEHYRSRNQLQDKTWRISWAAYFSQLPQDEVLTAKLATTLIESKAQNSETRKNMCLRLGHLLTFAGIDLDLTPYKGNYSQARTQHRELPTDELIAEWRDRIEHPGWQWLFGIIAASGMRPHEAFFCEWSADGLRVTQGKTGQRLIHELFYPEWVDQWQLKRIVRPPFGNPQDTYAKGRLGQQISRGFKRLRIPFTPYDLRHAAAVRMTTVFQLPVTTSAALLGHDPDVHLKIYQKYISEKQVRESVRRALAKEDRPVVPRV